MSGPLDISLKDELLFLKSLLIPCFNPDNELDTSKKRKEWLETRGEQKKWSVDILTELIEQYGTVKSLEEAETKLMKAERLLEKAEENERKQGAKLEDGLPELRQNLSLSPPSVPTEIEHAPCHRQIADLPFVAVLTGEIMSATNTVWRMARTSKADGGKYLVYSSEADIVYYVRRYLEDVLFALGIPLDFNAEVTIKQIRPDLCVLFMGTYLVGVIEVKKPGNNVLLEPTVLGELLDQMLLVEGFYGMGPVIGILTTAEEWVVSWFPVDSSALARGEVEHAEGRFTTPLKPASSTFGETKESCRYSPPGGTPSQKSGRVHSIEMIGDVSPGLGEDNSELSQQMDRLLCATDVVSIVSDPHRVLQLLCSAFQLMARSRLHHRANLSRCLLKFHKGIHAVTFHPKSHEDVYPMVNFDKFPSKNIRTLVALEDLGRGSTGKAWLCVTVTQPRSAVCVLKFDNKHAFSSNLAMEKAMWDLLYPELAHMTKLEQWSGADALVMPHFATVLEEERDLYRDELVEVLVRFVAKGKVHRDVRWRNIGKYRSSGKAEVVVYDLHDIVDYDATAHSNWVDDTVAALYGDKK